MVDASRNNGLMDVKMNASLASREERDKSSMPAEQDEVKYVRYEEHHDEV
jgi:hypothetical protein